MAFEKNVTAPAKRAVPAMDFTDIFDGIVLFVFFAIFYRHRSWICLFTYKKSILSPKNSILLLKNHFGFLYTILHEVYERIYIYKEVPYGIYTHYVNRTG